MVRIDTLLAGAFIALLAGAPVLAQEAGSPRPYRGLFGNATERTARQRLDATISVAAAYDSDVPGGVQSIGLVQPESIGHSSLLVNRLQYGWTSRPVQVEASGEGSVRYYPAADEIRIVNGAASLAMTAPLPARSAMAFTQSATYTPSYLYALFPQSGAMPLGDVPPPVSPDYAVNGTAAYSYVTATTLAYDPLGTNSFIAAGDYQQTETRGGPMTQGLAVLSLQGQYGHRFSRNITATGLYRYRDSDISYGTATTSGRFKEHGVEAGLQYRRPLSATRELSVEGRLGSAALRLPESMRALSVRSEPYRMLGDFKVAYRFLRTWSAHGSYRGSIEYVAGLSEPVSTDGVNTGVDGFLTRRISLLGSAAYSSGESTWTPNEIRFSTYTGNARLRVTVTSLLSVYGEYFYYFYDFSGTAHLVPGIPKQLERHGVRAGFTMLLPVLRSR